MTLVDRRFRVLGIAFLLQFITSFGSGLFLQPAWLVPEDIRATMIQITNNPGLMRANILVDMLTALGIIFLGAMLFASLRKENEKDQRLVTSPEFNYTFDLFSMCVPNLWIVVATIKKRQVDLI